jgi:hypothetical protein
MAKRQENNPGRNMFEKIRECDPEFTSQVLKIAVSCPAFNEPQIFSNRLASEIQPKVKPWIDAVFPKIGNDLRASSLRNGIIGAAIKDNAAALGLTFDCYIQTHRSGYHIYSK